MSSLWLAQYLCPLRHALFALAYDVELTPREEIERGMKDVIATGTINPWCGICHSRDLHIEHGKLFTDDWDEAKRILKAGEQANLASRTFFERSKN